MKGDERDLMTNCNVSSWTGFSSRLTVLLQTALGQLVKCTYNPCLSNNTISMSNFLNFIIMQ